MHQGTAIFSFVIAFISSALAVIIVRLILRHRGEQMLHQERLAALEKGVNVPLSAPLPATSRVYLLRGLMWTLSSAGLIVCLLGFALSDQNRSESAANMAWRARDLSQSLGISLQDAQRIVEKDRTRRGMPLGVALMGLVPLGVGIAYLAFYKAEQSRVRAELAPSGPPAARG
jgi:hypothetical protein